MDHPIFPKLPKSNVEGCKDPKSKFELSQIKTDRFIAIRKKYHYLWNTLCF